MLGGAIIQDLQSATAALQSSPVPTLALIDEFSAVASQQVVRLFGRARSAGISVVLGTQELSDLRLAGQERTLERVLGNVGVLLAHRQGVPESADLIPGWPAPAERGPCRAGAMAASSDPDRVIRCWKRAQ